MSYIIGGIFIAAVIAVYIVLYGGKVKGKAENISVRGCCGGYCRDIKKQQ